MNFKNFYFDEKEMFVGIDKEPEDITLGKIDTNDEHYAKKVNRIKSQLNIDEVKKAVNILLEGKNLKAFEKEITLVFVKYTTDYKKLEVFANAVKGENSFNYSKSFTLNQMYEHYNQIVPNAVHSKLYVALYYLVPSTGAAGQIGKGEILFSLLTKLNKAKKGGDLIDVDGSLVEVKSDLARMKGGKKDTNIYSQEAFNELSKIIKIDFKEKGIGQGTLRTIFNFLQKNKKMVPKVLQILVNYRNINLPKEALLYYNTIKNENDFFDLTLAIHAYAYIQSEKIEKIFFIKGNNLENIEITVFKFTDFNNLLKFIKSKLSFVGAWSESQPGFQFSIK